MNEFQNFREDNLTDSEEQERILTFINSMNVRNTAFLREREEEALAENIPIIRPQTQSLIRFFLDLVHPDSILEVGTATGFSSLFMLSYAPYAAITTIERDGDRIIRARQNFERGHAAGLPRLTGSASLRETQRGFFRRCRIHTDWSSWMPQKGSTSISCRK